MELLLHLGESSDKARQALEEVFADDPNGAGKLAWAHKVQSGDLRWIISMYLYIFMYMRLCVYIHLHVGP